MNDLDGLKKLWRFLTSPEMILYLVFGVLTTVINIAVFGLCHGVLHWSWPLSNVLAWVLAVAFAFLTNKLWVFRSRSFAAAVLWRELASFFAARLFSLGVDMLGMWLLIDALHWDELLSKVLVNVVVVIVNYVLSKLIIFRHQS